jgi:hypothetical protein
MATKTKTLPEFKGKPLIEIPEIIPVVNFLEGNFGRVVLEEYKGRAKADYNNVSALDVLSYDEVVKGSNPFAVVLVNQIVSPEGLRTATHADLERAIKANALPLNGHYEDTGLVLRGKENPNRYLARDLMAQIKARNPKAKMPAMVPLSELELVADENSPYKLGFKLKENAQIFYDLSVLNKDRGFSSGDIDENTGLPRKTTSNGDRFLYTKNNSGLCGLFLGRGLCVGSVDEDLAYSDGGGRVVVVGTGGTAKNLEQYMTQLQKERDKQVAEINARFDRAKAVLQGK